MKIRVLISFFKVACMAVTVLSGLRATGAETIRTYLSGQGHEDPVDWEFFCTAGRNSGFWDTIPVPSCWEMQGFGTLQYGFTSLASQSSERGLYRRSFPVPAEWSDQRVEIVFEGVLTDTEVKVNGVLAGPRHQGGYMRFRYDISDLLAYGEENLLEVEVWKKSSNTSVNNAERTADYWIYGGIFRPVFLEVRPRESIQGLSLDPRHDGSLAGWARLDPPVQPATLHLSLSTVEGTPVADLPPITVAAGEDQVDISAQVPGILPWTMETPNLYVLTTQLRRDGTLLHEVRERIGFRSIEIRPGDGVYLNGTRIRIKGISYPASWPTAGKTTSPSQSRLAVQLIKGMNMNAVRPNSYPADTHFYEACDELGLLALGELPGWQADTYDTAVGSLLVRSMIDRDVNHPSIVFWANGNEGGFNPDLIALYPQHDPQGRPVIQPGSSYAGDIAQGGVDTTHYVKYAGSANTLLDKLQGPNLFMPTEFLHGMYDGGHGAGLRDQWQQMRASPFGVGGYLWVFQDEAILREDGSLDTDGSNSADGLVGPYYEKEPSYDAVREIWSHVVVETAPVLDFNFDGKVDLLNDYYFTSLDACGFRWELVRFAGVVDASTDPAILASGELPGPEVGPQQTGTLQIPLPMDWHAADALRLIANGPDGTMIRAWTWPIQAKAELVARQFPPGAAGNAILVDAGNAWQLEASGRRMEISKTSGLIRSASVYGTPVPLSNGPRLVAGTATLTSIATRMEGPVAVVDAAFTGNLGQLTYRMEANGMLEIQYAFAISSGSYANIGLTFDFPEAAITRFRWMGDGPQPVWKNRTDGVEFGVWEKEANEALPGEVWTTDPVFRGFHANFHWGSLSTDSTLLTVLTDTPGLFFRLGTPQLGSGLERWWNARFEMPPGNLSLLTGIAPHGNKFHSASFNNIGPSSAPNAGAGSYTGRLFLLLDETVSQPAILSVEAVDPYRIRIRFNREMDAGAFEPSSYSITPGRVIHAVFREDVYTALLDIQPLTGNESYSLAVSTGLVDLEGAPLEGSLDFPLVWRSGLVADWPFDDAAAAVSPDVSGNDRAASLLGPTILTPGRRLLSLALNGQAGTGATFHAPPLDRFTLSAWLWLNGSGSSDYPRILTLGGDQVQFALNYSGPTGLVALNVAGYGDWRAEGTAPFFGQWSHLAVSFDPSSGNPPQFYVDGVPRGIASMGTSAGTYATSGLSGIGNRPGDLARPVDGLLDDVRIYDGILSPGSIAALAASPPTLGMEEWLNSYGLALAERSEDTDRDGVSNPFERLFGRSPIQAECGPRALFHFQEGKLRVRFPVSDEFAEALPTLEVSRALGPDATWETVSPLDAMPWRRLENTTWFSMETDLEFEPEPRVFYRLALPLE